MTRSTQHKPRKCDPKMCSKDFTKLRQLDPCQCKSVSNPWPCVYPMKLQEEEPSEVLWNSSTETRSRSSLPWFCRDDIKFRWGLSCLIWQVEGALRCLRPPDSKAPKAKRFKVFNALQAWNALDYNRPQSSTIYDSAWTLWAPSQCLYQS